MEVILPVAGIKIEKYPAGNITQWYGENPALYQASTNLQYHNGWDIVKGYGVPILSVYDGRVVEVKRDDGGYGRHVTVLSQVENEIAYVTIYGHLTDNILVNPGDVVKKGQQLGEMGNSGHVISGGITFWGGANPDKKGTHLHFGVKKYILDDTFKATNNFFGTKFRLLNEDNGVFGSFDPVEFYMPQIDIREVMSKDGKTIWLAVGAPNMETLEALKTLIVNFGGTVKPQIESKDL